MLMKLIEYACPHCNARHGAVEDRAGTSQVCCDCKTAFPIPVGLRPREVEVGDSPRSALAPEEEAAVRNALARQGAGPTLAGMVADRLLRTLIEALLRRLGIRAR